MLKVLVVAPTPPPHGGMTIMVQRLLESEMAGVRLIHVRMALSSDASEIGRFRLSKIMILCSIVFRIVYRRFVENVRVLYYVPAGPDRMPIFRDFFILLSTRWLFKRTIFHFHSAGLSELYETLPSWQQWLFRRAYFGADGAIRLSTLNPEDGRRLAAHRDFVIPYGIDDPCPDFTDRKWTDTKTPNEPLRILFLAILYESKGLMVLIDACAKLAACGVPFQLEVVGQWQKEEYAVRVRQRIQDLNLKRQIHFLGPIIGADKFAAYRRANVFCFPTYFNCEALPVVLLEAMACGLPIVSTRWRGIPSMVEEGHTGFLVETHDAEAVANRLTRLAENWELREQMGIAGREKFEREFTISRHLERMRGVFLEIAGFDYEGVHELPKPSRRLEQRRSHLRHHSNVS